ncbi:MAG: type VI secretion system baseplate subunit TssG [Limnobacter sp.]|uniref:type VI secretion system baseplate subunit TssG n=1 Tax=Limnobacter sp. TaxID=2003368 RepID=UPI0032EFAFFD
MSRSLPPAPNFFALLRQIEHANPGKPLLGTSLRLRDDPIRLGQHPHLDFATQDFQREETIQAGRLGAVQKLYVQNFGLLGPNGALPLHYTEHAYTRIHHWNDPTFSEFLDVFHHRAYLLFYRAWAESQPHIGYHRKSHNPFAQRLNSLVGHGVQSSWGREQLPTHFRAGLAGHFSRRTKTQEGLACALSACTGQAVQVKPFQAQWLQLQKQAGVQALGRGAMLGSRVWCAQSKITICVGPMPYPAYQKLLPGTPGRTQLIQATHAYLGFEFDCDYEIQISTHHIPKARLNGTAQLGRTAWAGEMRIHQRQQLPATVRMKCPAVPSQSSLSRSSA